MFNIQPGTGLGSNPSRQIAFSLGSLIEAGEIIFTTLVTFVALSKTLAFTAINKMTGFVADDIKTFFKTKDPE